MGVRKTLLMQGGARTRGREREREERVHALLRALREERAPLSCRAASR